MPPRIPPTAASPFSTTTLLSSLPSIPTRQFSSTPSFANKSSKKKLSKILSNAPPYPYPIRPTYKQSWFGLYASKHIQFGNNIPEKEFTITRRKWYPNIKHKKLWSFGLGEWVDCKLATGVLRTIDKVGGLDNYLLSEKPARLKELGPWGWELRHRLQSTKAIQRRYQNERLKMGLITVPQMLKQNKKLGINRGVQLKKATYKKVVTPSRRDNIPGFEERWMRSGKVDKVLFGEPWRWTRYSRLESARERRRKKVLLNKRLRSREAVMARKKIERRAKKKELARKAQKVEDEKMERLSKLVAVKRDQVNPLGI
ncbi:hypothetical protein ABW19_dt0200402 [Dactylella cylindrospora]|nr:hypothetical protein ABW19_dt0200402 [Dactylella cylindrospora]